ncbi:hypothetical protein SAMN02745883_02191 [Caminicella sporogenes DSM 14501]|uniref:Uncharacterized protein n=1 Tax=Caminicella sporogenes DSM 14501 TaxID=1121266 RepID=A0A1M6SZJ6_9FIRM|nr:hypothetical protein [Caminicella sporogenes]RKD26390.1 hypothetical protein BET04_10870 [Caminicella sporogenes]SHK50121.1 hypothetical protein SAMN02745883_02191 [Caminicella sporogenes DSM 14501]
MLFPDYIETNVVYHVISILDLDNALKNGIKYNDKRTYKSKYLDFHIYIDNHKPDWIPSWVIRKKAIFASLNFDKYHKFHSHTAILGIKINPNRCWVANENLANHIYEPFILSKIVEYEKSNKYLLKEGKNLLRQYWETSLSFNENLKKRYDQRSGYDAEVLIMHDIKPKDLKVLYIISDHYMLTSEKWKKYFCLEN